MAGRPLSVAVVGAGIGGLAVGTALRLRGVDARVYEQATALTSVGAGIAVGANGSRLLARLGATERLEETAVRPERAQFHRWADGTPFCSHEMGAHYESLFGAPFYTVHRGDLQRVLRDTYVAAGGEVLLGRACAGVAQDADGVELSFRDGSTARADVLIGADGVHSAIRTTVAGPDTAVFSGTSGFRGLAPVDRLPRVPELGFDPARPALWLFPGPGRHLISYPVSGGRLVNFLAVIPDPGWTLESWVAEDDPANAVAAFAGWNPVVTALLGAVDEISRWALYDREPLAHWSFGRITLLGDAAHPMLPHHGQGGNQAIEDAIVLANCLAGAEPGDVAAALRAYESARRPRARQLQLGSRRNGECFQVPDGPATEERDRRLATLPDQLAFIHGHDVEHPV
ncbi:hypothetical protein F0L68_07475 [Solihabitans fulvus]|uniref:FAD-binding domain-containing protein n=1 Tax=Solihabitans fulvus TaxID=1892852 RepID=A0A5B2XMD0_9PSEU|nr:FAD-dependent monooxygenase [Solihabitans fulvus]KAA2264897.1 hypothetical protein F0L68_07475 [Solihabitans fulvus]